VRNRKPEQEKNSGGGKRRWFGRKTWGDYGKDEDGKKKEGKGLD